ncbi:MAG TPA: DinB family protein [Acidobacteriota bacterium]|nr:DinB family protein [Acidobacteriota bacterium]
MSALQRPDQSEYFKYYHNYISRVPDGDLLQILEDQAAQTVQLLGGLSEEDAERPLGEGKWCPKQIMCHLIDSERMFAFRALSFARKDPASLPSFEQDEWVENSNAMERGWSDLIEEFLAARRSHLALLRGFPEEAWTRTGTASGYSFTVRALAYVMAGHELHHQEALHNFAAAHA